MGRLEGWVVKLCCWKRWCRRSCPNSMADHFGFLFSMKGVAEGEKVLNGTNGGLGRVIVHHHWKSCWPRKERLTKYFGNNYVVLELVLFLKIEWSFAVIGQDFVSVGYKYEPPGYCKDWYTSNKHKFTLLAIYFFVGDFAIFFFSASSFKFIKNASHSSDLVCWKVFLPSKSEL